MAGARQRAGAAENRWEGAGVAITPEPGDERVFLRGILVVDSGLVTR
ncbi:MAG: hypothetical protein H0Z39_08050 [Peptococcaceae bacterium]|nr:hypothetical protein [Peptococcaceae bacterium]